MKLSLKIPLIFVVISVLPMALLAIFYYFGAKNLLQDEAMNRLETAVIIQERRVEDIVDGYRQRVQSAASQTGVLTTVQQFATARTPMAQKSANAALAEQLAAVRHSYDAVQNVTVYLPDGNVAGSTMAAVAARADGSSPWDAAFAKGKVATDLSTLYKDAARPATSQHDRGSDVRLYAATPIVRQEATIGVLVMEMKVDDLYELFLENTGLGESGDWVLGVAQADGDALLLVPSRFDADPDAPLKQEVSRDKVNTPIMQALQKNEKLYNSTSDYHGQRVLAATRFIPGVEWGLVVKISADEAYAPITQLRTILISASVLLALAAVVASVYVAGSVVLPLRRLTSTAKLLAEGNLTHRSRLRRKDEIGMLAKAFNAMADRLQDVYAQLEEKVDHKTLELGEKVRDLQQTQGAMLNLVEDLNEEKMRLAEEKGRAEAIVENIGEGIISTDKRGNIVFINQIAEELLGITTEDALGRSAAAILKLWDGSEPLPASKHPLTGIMAASERQATAARYQKADGKSLYLAVVASPITVEGVLVGAIAAFRDVTEQQAIDRAKSEFVTLASHQLRTPISAISWFSEMLIAGDVGELSQEQREHVEQIYHSNKRMANLVNQMLTISGIELGNLPVKPEPLDLPQLTRTIMDELQAAEEDYADRHIRVDHDPKMPKISLDRDIIRQILQALMSNALKYTPRGGSISLEITAVKEKLYQGSKGSIGIVISDNGYGITKAAQGKIFSKFFRGDNIRSKDTDGTGLSLYITRELLHYVGGRISFTSTEGKGSTFVILLPQEGMETKVPGVTDKPMISGDSEVPGGKLAL